MLKNAHNLPQYIELRHIQTLTEMKANQLAKIGAKNNTYLLPNHMNLHILHYFLKWTMNTDIDNDISNNI